MPRGVYKHHKHSEETKKKMSESIRANPTRYWLGKTRPPLTNEWKNKISKALKGVKKSEEHRKNISLNKRGLKTGIIPNGAFIKGYKLTKEQIAKRLRRRDISSLELRVKNVIEKFDLPYKFVGNGNFFIERKNPDFVNTNGKKIAIEVYARKHKDMFRGGTDKWKKERMEIFKKYGWSIIFIEEWQTNTEGSILELIGGDHGL